jgi:hypothetical protein
MAKRKSNPLTSQTAVRTNKRGEFTKSQRNRLSEMLRPSIFWWFGLFFVVLGVSSILSQLLDEGRAIDLPTVAFGLMMIGIGSLAVLVVIWLHLRRYLLLRGLDKEVITHGLGQVRWRWRDYRAEINGRRLKAPAGLSLPPGDYEFYYVAKRRWLLSAESISEIGSVNLTKLLSVLAQTNGFTLEDLAANREGHMTSRQIRGSVIELLKSLVFWFFAFVIGGIAIVLVVDNFLGRERLPSTWLIGASCGVVFGAFSIGAAVIWGQRELRKILLDIRDRRVKMVAGHVSRTVEVDVDDEGGDTKYYYLIGNHTFRVSRTGYAALVDDLRYRLYYTPRTKRLASIEPLADDASASS